MDKDDILKRLKIAKGANFDAHLGAKANQRTITVQGAKSSIASAQAQKKVVKTEVQIDKAESERVLILCRLKYLSLYSSGLNINRLRESMR